MSSKLLSSLVLTSAFFCSLPSIAETITVSSQGTALTRQMARAEAIKDAIMQVSGVTLDAETLQYLASDQYSDGQKEETAIRTQQQQQLKEKIRGTVSSFRILDESKNSDGTITLRLEVAIEKYTPPGIESKRRSISVQGFDAGNGICFGKKISEEDQIRAITEAVQTAFVTSRKFAILDRHSDAYKLEKDFINSGDTKASEQAKLGLNKGADYVVTGNVRYLKIDETKRKLQLSNGTQINREARADFGFNLMMFATREIQLSSNVSVKLTENINGLSCAEIVSRLTQKAASEIARKATQSIYPPKVINTAGRMIYFNYGGDEVKVGEIFNLYSEGEAIYDPYTKEPLGNVETLIARVRVVDVKPKYSVATWADSEERAPVKVGDILRPYQEPQQKASNPPKKSAKSRLKDEW